MIKIPETVRLNRKEFSRCLSYFGRLYALLMKRNLGREDFSELRNLPDYIEEYCLVDTDGVKDLLDEAYREYLRGDYERAQYLVMKALGRVRDSLSLAGGW